MANYTTSQDLILDIAFRAGEPAGPFTATSGDYFDAIVRYLNRAYQGMWRGGGELLPSVSERWWWLTQYGNGVITLLPVEDDGTVVVTSGSQTITFSAIPQRSISGVATNISLQGWHFKAEGHADVFRISSHTAGNVNATIDSMYTGDTALTSAYKAFKLDYSLASDVLDIIGPMRAFQGSSGDNQITRISEEAMKVNWPLEQANPGVPVNFARIGFDTTNSLHVIRFSHYGGTTDTDLMRIDYDYLYEPADLGWDADEPLVPREYRKVLADWALFFVLQDKEDSRAQEVFQMAASGLKQMALENRRMSVRQGDRARIHSRLGQRSRFRKGPLRTEQGFIITG